MLNKYLHSQWTHYTCTGLLVHPETVVSVAYLCFTANVYFLFM